MFVRENGEGPPHGDWIMLIQNISALVNDGAVMCFFYSKVDVFTSFNMNGFIRS